MRDFEYPKRHPTLAFFNSISAFVHVRKESKSTEQGLHVTKSSVEHRKLVERYNNAQSTALATREREEIASYLGRKVYGTFEKRVDRVHVQ